MEVHEEPKNPNENIYTTVIRVALTAAAITAVRAVLSDVQTAAVTSERSAEDAQEV